MSGNKKKKLLNTNANKRPISFVIRNIIISIMGIGVFIFLPGRHSNKSLYEAILSDPVETLLLILFIVAIEFAFRYFGSLMK